jgi:hypothetical protein
VDQVHDMWTGWRAWVHGGPSGDVLLAQGTPGATRLQSSLARFLEEEGDEAKLMRWSPEHERQRRGDMMAMNIGGSLSSTRAQKRARESSGMRGSGAWCSGGWSLPFVGAGGASGRQLLRGNERR